MKNEITVEQSERQDDVDMRVRALIGELVPEQYIPEGGSWYDVIAHDGKAIGKVRDAIKEIIHRALDIQPGDEDSEFEMAFYPVSDK